MPVRSFLLAGIIFFEVIYTKWYKPKCNRILRKCIYGTLKMACLSEKYNVDFFENYDFTQKIFLTFFIKISPIFIFAVRLSIEIYNFLLLWGSICHDLSHIGRKGIIKALSGKEIKLCNSF